MEYSSILRTEDDFKEVQLAWVVVHVDRDDWTWPRASQEVLVTHGAVLLAEAAHFMHLVAVKVDVEELIIVHEQAVHAFPIHVHLLRVLLSRV